MRKKKNSASVFMCALFLSTALLFGGCGNERIEEQTKLRDEGIVALQAGDYGKAEELFDQALHHANAYVTEREININYYKAAAQFLKPDHDGAIKTYTNLITYDEENPDAYFLRGSVYLDIGEGEKGIADYHRAAAASDGDYDLHIEIYNNLMEMGYIGDASEFLNLALEIEGDSAENYLNRGRIYLILDQYEVAKTTLEKAVEKGSDEAKVYLAEVYANRGNDDDAKKLIDEYLAGEKVESEALAKIGNLLIDQGDYEGALSTFRRGLDLEEVKSKKELQKGEITALEYTGDFEQAKQKGDAFVALYPAEGDVLREMIFLNTR